MQVVQTAGTPPNQGRMNLLISGCTWNNRKAASRLVAAKFQAGQAICRRCGLRFIRGLLLQVMLRHNYSALLLALPAHARSAISYDTTPVGRQPRNVPLCGPTRSIRAPSCRSFRSSRS